MTNKEIEDAKDFIVRGLDIVKRKNRNGCSHFPFSVMMQSPEWYEKILNTFMLALQKCQNNPQTSSADTVSVRTDAGAPADLEGTPDRGKRFRIEHDGFQGTVIGHYERLDGEQGVVMQQDGCNVVHVYRKKWLTPIE